MAETLRLRQLAWRKANPEKFRAQMDRHAERHPEVMAARAKRSQAVQRAKDPVAFNAKAAARTAKHRAKNREAVLQRTREWRAANPEHGRNYSRQRRILFPDEAKENRDLRRARVKGARTTGRVSRRKIIERDGGKCYLCGCFPTGRNLTLDHVIPLTLGGAHHELNLRVACRSCNSRKQAKMPTAGGVR